MMAMEFFSTRGGEVIDLRPTHIDQLIGRMFETFDLACDLHELEAAQDILHSTRLIMARHGLPADAGRDRSAQLLVDAHYRLWELRYLVR